MKHWYCTACGHVFEDNEHVERVQPEQEFVVCPVCILNVYLSLYDMHDHSELTEDGYVYH